MDSKYKVSDFFYYLIKQLIFFFMFHLVGYVAYALSVGHIIRDELVDRSAKTSSLVIFSIVMLAALSIFKYLREKNDVGRKSRLIEASRADDFDSMAYYKDAFLRKVLPYTVASGVFILPYSIFYMFYGFGYENALITERFFAPSMAGIVLFWGVFGVIIQSAILGGVYALFLYRIQKRELDDRMWIKDAPKQEKVELHRPKDNYKNY